MGVAPKQWPFRFGATLNLALGGLQRRMYCQLLNIPQRAANGTDFLGGIRDEG